MSSGQLSPPSRLKIIFSTDYQWNTTIPVKGEMLSDANFLAGYGSIALQISITVSVYLLRYAIMHPNRSFYRLSG